MLQAGSFWIPMVTFCILWSYCAADRPTCNSTNTACGMTTNYTCVDDFCFCTSGYYNDSVNNICRTPNYGENCNRTTAVQCDGGYQCLPDKNSIERCLCNSTEYRTDSNLCKPVNTNLKVSDIGNTSSTNSVKFTWSSTSIENDNATFLIQYGNSSAITALSNGGNISQLQSRTRYNFSIVVIIPNDTYNEQKIGPFSYVTTWTVENLKVSNVTNISTTTSVNFNWSSIDINNDNATFYINIGSYGVIPATNTYGFFANLSSGTKYTFSIVVKIPSDKYYASKSGPPVNVTVWTVPVYGDICANNPNCQSGSECLKDKNQILRCICNESQYRADNGTCSPIGSLQVINTNIVRTTTSVTINWTSSHINRNTVMFNILTGSQNYSANTTGGTIDQLVSGSLYSFNITVTIPEDNYYTTKIGLPTNVSFWTYPAPPGRITDVSLLQGTNDTYVITFPKSDGNVSKYFILIKDHPTYVLNSSDILNTQIIVRGLIAGTTYSYSLYALNGGGDFSTYTNGTFISNSAKSGPVSNLAVKEFTNTSVTLSWQKPASPNGNITGYLLEVNLSGSCVDSYRFICNNCINNTYFDSNCSNFQNVSKSFEDLENIIQYTIQNLRPYRNYTFTVYAVNEKGKGKESHIQQRTKPGTPEKVTNIQILANRSPPDYIGLKVSWTPGELTGPTNYTVCLKERTSINNDSFNSINCSEVFVLEKYNLTIEFPNLKAFWNYSVEIKATTEVSSTDWVTSETVRTFTNTPGNATFQVIQDPITATKVNITITCPDENSRNGTILRYVIFKRNMNDSKSENQTIRSGINCPGYTTAELTGIEVEKMYSFTVIVKNQDYGSNESPSKTITIEPRKPDINSTIISKGSVLTSSEVQVTLCVDCILDKCQGTVTKAGLAVCLEVPKSPCSSQSRRKRSTLQDYDNLTSWEKSKSNNFALEYRTTPDNWLQKLEQFRSLVMPYTIGNESSCKPGDFCNGPLPENTKIRVTIIVCTAAGCSSSIVSNLQTQAGPTDNVPAVVGGVVGGILGLALIVTILLIICCKRQSRHPRAPANSLQTQGQDDNTTYSALNLAFTDRHQYYGFHKDNKATVEYSNIPTKVPNNTQEIDISREYQNVKHHTYNNILQ
ncbi:hypothetical protein Btru_075496 [Bulinus truncatus]|nr:hypothetical protein Btru_075496 [Bulinus truncatus]